MTAHDPYRLYYWPSIQGRGELVRLALEEAAAPYVDVARLPPAEGGGVEAIRRVLEGSRGGGRHLAPPVLEAGDVVVSQTACILDLLAERHALLCPPEVRRRALQLQLTISDLIGEAHDTHHPIAVSAYYEDQREEAKRRAAAFLKERMPKFLGYLEQVLADNAASHHEHLVGAGFSYVDLGAFQLLSGLAYAFPRAFAAEEASIPRLLALRDRIAARPRIAAYLASPRRLPFSEHGIFRRYPELDAITGT